MMTIEVYKIDQDGRRTEVVPRYEVGTGDPERLQPDDLGYPPCTCPRCRAARRSVVRR
ncbi:hypothetical protein ABT121_43540 [Streptomyces sp. NPDC001928]|uniref:hypothetical protein n=1 Tax=Streptomyces sp. NPDC001928 TaxID=3154404 RepID=UPI003317DF27